MLGVFFDAKRESVKKFQQPGAHTGAGNRRIGGAQHSHQAHRIVGDTTRWPYEIRINGLKVCLCPNWMRIYRCTNSWGPGLDQRAAVTNCSSALWTSNRVSRADVPICLAATSPHRDPASTGIPSELPLALHIRAYLRDIVLKVAFWACGHRNRLSLRYIWRSAESITMPFWDRSYIHQGCCPTGPF